MASHEPRLAVLRHHRRSGDQLAGRLDGMVVMSRTQWLRLEWMRFALWLKTWFHPESLGNDRRKQPRRRADRIKQYGLRLWLAVLTVFWFGMAWSLQNQINTATEDRIAATKNRCDLIRDVRLAAIDLGADPNSTGIARLQGREEECRAQLKVLKGT